MPTKQAEKIAAKKQHPLAKKIVSIPNWHAWLQLWNATDQFQILESLLHSGYGISLSWGGHGEPGYKPFDRHEFYLAIADGWKQGYDLLAFPGDREDRNTSPLPEIKLFDPKERRMGSYFPYQVRERLARKALAMLCQEFFKVRLINEDSRDRDFDRVWFDITSEEFFPVIQGFFAIMDEGIGGRVRIRNLPSRDEQGLHREVITDFLLKLARVLWGWREPSYYVSPDKKAEHEARTKETKARIDQAKPWMIEVLAALGETELLREWLLDLDQPCLAKLKEIALRTELSRYQHPVEEDRPVQTVSEALYARSMAAQLLIEHEVKLREHKRLTALREAQREAAKATKRVRELTTT